MCIREDVHYRTNNTFHSCAILLICASIRASTVDIYRKAISTSIIEISKICSRIEFLLLQQYFTMIFYPTFVISEYDNNPWVFNAR